MHYIKNTECHAVIHHYWYNLRYSTSESHTWQKGQEAMAFVPQYLLYNVIWKVLGQTKQWYRFCSLLYTSALWQINNSCVNNFMEWNRFYIHTYIKYLHKLYMYTERKKRKEKPSFRRNTHHQPHWKLSDNRFQCSRQWKISPRRKTAQCKELYNIIIGKKK